MVMQTQNVSRHMANQLEFNNKERTLYSIAILHSGRFREGRSQTKVGRRLYNKELRIAKRKVKKYKIKLNKPLPKKLRV